MVATTNTLYRLNLLACVMGLAAHSQASANLVPLTPQVPAAAAGPDPDQPQPPKAMPPIEKLALPEEQPQLAELMRSLGNVNRRDPKAMLAVFDGTLAKLP